MEAVECGAACLGMVLAYHERHVPLEELRLACGVSRDGSKASNIVRAGRTYGMTAKAYKREPKKLVSLPMPAIIHWNFNHFLVLEGFKDDRVFLNDPASGPRLASLQEEFDESFTGVVLVFEPGPDFVPSGDRPNILNSLRPRLAGSQAALAYLLLAGIALVIPGLVIPIFSRIFVDSILIHGLRGWLLPLLVGMGLTALLRAALSWLQGYHLLRATMKMALDSAPRFFWHTLRLPIEFFAQRYSGDVSGRVALNNDVAALLSGDLTRSLLNVLLVFFYAFLMFRYDAPLTIIGISFALLNILGLWYVSRKRTDASRKSLQEQGKLLGVAMASLQGIETVKASGTEAEVFTSFSGYQAKVVNSMQEFGVISLLLGIMPEVLAGINTAAILILGGFRVMDGHLTVGMLVAFQSLMVSFNAPVQQLVGLAGNLQEMEGKLARLDDVLKYRQDTQFQRPSSANRHLSLSDEPAKLAGHVALQEITFGYSRLAAPLIKEFNLVIEPGKRVALVGKSGSGKSTVAKLVAGLYEPWEGEIFLDGRRRAENDRLIIHNSLSIVDQEITLFEGSIKDNLTMWDSTVKETDILQAAKDACIHDDIAERAGNYDALIDEGGDNFSGGQRQRLEIARALASNPRVLVMDEATSALDTKTEAMVDSAIRRRGCTCLIVAHRLSTIRDCDEIIVLEHGREVQRGTHDALFDIEGQYRELVSSEG